MHVGMSCYLEGLINLSYELSSNLGPSGIRVTCFSIKDFEKKFQKYFKIRQEIVIGKSSITLKELFLSWFKDENIVNSLIDLFMKEIGDIKCIYEADNTSPFVDKLSGDSNGLSGFYFVEEVYFLETSKYMISFIIGNNE